MKESPDRKKNIKFYLREVLGILSSKKNKIGILQNKFTRKLLSSRQSSLFLQSFLIQNVPLTKILTQSQAMLQFYTP